MSRLGRRIKGFRVSKGLTQKEFGQMLSRPVTQSAVGVWERGDFKPDNQRLLEIADMMGLTAEELTDGNEDVQVVKIKKGLATVITWRGNRYVLDHQDTYKGARK